MICSSNTLMQAERFSSILEAILWRSIESPGKTAFSFENQAVSFLELWQGITQFASFASSAGVKKGDRVVLCVPNSSEFFKAFYGLQLIESIPVPIFPNSGVERILTICELCSASLVIVPSTLSEAQLKRIRIIASGHGIRIVTPKSSQESAAQDFPLPLDPHNIAFIQYTSGSTGNPKGVMLSQNNLITNVRQMIAGMEITSAEIFVSWLPVYHDMGLILKTMVPFFLGAVVHLLPTDLKDVNPWLKSIQEHQATFTAAPDFAYRLCLRHSDPSQYDLSSLRVALNAAEPVRHTTIREFEKAFKIPNTMVAGYGLAEATVGVSMWKPGTPSLTDSHGRVSVGKPFPGVSICIIDGDRILTPGQIGEIAIQSPANALGYFNNPEATATLEWKDHYCLSGDLGYLDSNGHLFIVGRKKNIIKRAGETISPQELEEIVDRSPNIRYSAAIGIDTGGIEGEQVFIFAEVRGEDQLDQDALYLISVSIVAEIYQQLGFRPARVYLLKSHTIPVTHNGKIQHALLKQRYTNKELQASGKILYPEF